MSQSKSFQPDWTSSPTKTILDILEKRKISLQDFSKELFGESTDALEKLNSDIKINTKIATKLKSILGPSTEFWLEREAQYRSSLNYLIKLKDEKETISWIKSLPIKDMIKRGWIKTRSTTEEMLKECLNFFEVENISSWHNKYNEEIQTSLFRTSLKYESNPGAVAAWIRRGEILSDSIQCKTWNPQKFKETLFELRSLTFKRDPNLFLQELRQKCSECGVAFVLLKAPEGCRASGVTKFLSKNKALIILSFRFLSNDHFWFSFFHEAGHLILHNKNSIFLEGISNTSNKEEDEANNFAAEILVPQRYKVELLSLKANKQSILNFSKTVGVHPGIIVGQMQHYNIIRRNQMNGFKRRYQWVTE